MKKIILLILMFTITSIFVNAEYTTNHCNEFVFMETGDFQCLNGSTAISPAPQSLMTTQSWTTPATSMKYVDNETKLGNMTMSTIGDDIERSAEYDLGNQYGDITVQGSFYHNSSDTGAYTYFRTEDNAGTYIMMVGVYTAGSVAEYSYRPSGQGFINSNINRITGWINFTLYTSPNAEYTALYINGTLINNDTTSAKPRYIYMYEGDGVNNIQSSYDNILVWEGTPEDRPAEVEQDITPPVITLSSPSNQARVNDEIVYFNFSVTDDSGNPIICILKNDTIQYDEGNFTQGENVYLSYTTSENQSQTIDFDLDCYDNTANNNSATIERQITIDRLSPFITITEPADDYYGDDVPVDVSCYDENIWIINYTLYDSDETVKSIQNDTNKSTADNGNLIIKDTITFSTLDNGFQYLNISCSDSHTDDMIPYYDITYNQGLKSIKYKVQNDDEITVRLIGSHNSDVESFSTYKESDRYVWVYDFDLIEDGTIYTYDFIVLAQGSDLRHIPESEYNAHFVTSENWIDFEFEGNEDAVYTVESIGVNYLVTIQTTKTYLEFHSIGGLNIRTVQDSFYACVDWTCDSYPACSLDDESVSCTAVVGTIAGCTDDLYTGDYSEFELSCDTDDTTQTILFGILSTALTVAIVVGLFYTMKKEIKRRKK